MTGAPPYRTDPPWTGPGAEADLAREALHERLVREEIAAVDTVHAVVAGGCIDDAFTSLDEAQSYAEGLAIHFAEVGAEPVAVAIATLRVVRVVIADEPGTTNTTTETMGDKA